MSPPNLIPPGLQSPATLAERLIFPASSGPSQLPPVFIQNPFESGSSGTSVSTANSAGPGARAFDTVTIGSNATVAYDSTHAAHGGLSCKFATGATSTTASIQWTNTSVGNQTQIWYRIYFYYTAFPSVAIRLLQINNIAGTIGASLKMTSAGKLQVADALNGTVTTGTTVLPFNQWIRIEGYFSVSSGSGQTEVKLFVNPESNTATETNTSTATQNIGGPIGGIQFGISLAGANVGPFWQDDVALSNTGYIGPVGVQASPQPAAVSTPPGFMSPMALARPPFFASAFAPPGAGVNVTGVTANVNISAPSSGAGITIFSAPSVQFPFSPVLPEPLNFIPAFFGLRPQQQNVVPLVPVPGSVANVNVASPSGTVTELIDGVGAVANVNAVAVSGSLLVTQPNPPNFAFLPLSPFQYIPALATLRQQTNTVLPDVFVPGATANVNISGQVDNSLAETVLGAVSNVNVSAPAGSLSITTSFPLPSPQPAILPNTLRFNPAYIGLRVQYNTGIPIVSGGVVGSVANVNVSGQPDNTVTEIVLGAVSNISVTAQPGSILITQLNPPQFAFIPLLPPPIRYNPAYLGLRQQTNTVLPDVFIPGSLANINISGQPDNIITETILGAAVNIAVSGQSNNIVTDSVSGVVSNINVQASGGLITETILGSTGNVNSVAVAGTVSSSGNNVVITGPVSIVTVLAPSGTVTLEPIGTWWRVYPAYRSYPTW